MEIGVVPLDGWSPTLSGAAARPQVLRSAIDRLRDVAGLTLVDGPPLTERSLGLALGRGVDGVILVIDEETSVDDAHEIGRRIALAGVQRARLRAGRAVRPAVDEPADLVPAAARGRTAEPGRGRTSRTVDDPRHRPRRPRARRALRRARGPGPAACRRLRAAARLAARRADPDHHRDRCSSASWCRCPSLEVSIALPVALLVTGFMVLGGQAVADVRNTVLYCCAVGACVLANTDLDDGQRADRLAHLDPAAGRALPAVLLPAAAPSCGAGSPRSSTSSRRSWSWPPWSACCSCWPSWPAGSSPT